MAEQIYYFDKDEFVKKYDEFKSSRKMAEYYGCDKGTILTFAKKIGYVNKYRTSVTKEEKEDIINRYYTSLAKDLAQEYGVSRSLILKIWMNANIKDKKNKCSYPFDIDYFEDINSPDKAYFLGLIAADGNIFSYDNIYDNKYGNKQALIRLTLQKEDKYILETFKSYLLSNKPLHNTCKETSDGVHYYRTLELVSNKMKDDLSKYNIVPTKTYNFIMPDLKEEYISHYIRGYFDGDGGISILDEKYHIPSAYQIRISGFKNNLDKMNQYLCKNDIHFYFIKDKREHNRKDVFGSIVAKSVPDAYKFIQYIYNNCMDLYISRKKYKCDCFLNAIKMNFSNKANKYKQLLLNNNAVLNESNTCS